MENEKSRTTRDVMRRCGAHVVRGVWLFLILVCMSVVAVSCAKMGSPDGGWYDETPPRIIRSVPEDRSVNVGSQKIQIYFNEYIAIENASEKVVVSPPQLETPEITAGGKVIKVVLLDSLRDSTTYTVDFSDAISDNNENNPLGNYTYTFSTGDVIDTLEVAGYVVEAENMEPIKGILVGLYANLEDSAFTTEPMLRVSRTDSRGRFIIRGVAPGSYRIYALDDVDGDYRLSQKSEKLAFSRDIIIPTFKDDIRQDTVWRDSLHIETIRRVPYTHFLPDDIVMRAFTETQTNRYFLKSERNDADRFTLYFSYGEGQMPEIRGLNFDEDSAFVIESNAACDTLTYWLRDTLLVNQDTLNIEMTYLATDTLGELQSQTDTIEILAKQPYAKRLKEKEKEYEEWKKKQDKAMRRGLPYDTIMRTEPMKLSWKAPSELDLDKNISLSVSKPLAVADTSKIHLYSKIDTLWYRSPFIFRERKNSLRTYELLGEWRPGIEYSLEVDSAAFIDIYGTASEAYKQGFRAKTLDAYGTLLFTFNGMENTAVVAQLLDTSDKVVKQVRTSDGTAEFFYLNPATYYLRIFIDDNGNGKWDTGDYASGRQAETVYYYPKQITCRAKWDVTLEWTPGKATAGNMKPAEITKQKAEKTKAVKNRNAERARKMGITYVNEDI